MFETIRSGRGLYISEIRTIFYKLLKSIKLISSVRWRYVELTQNTIIHGRKLQFSRLFRYLV